MFQKLDDLHFQLIVIGQPVERTVAAGLEDVLRVQAIPDNAANRAELQRVGISGPAFYLLRPDGHVGLAGTRLDTAALARYLADCHVLARRGADDRATTPAVAV
ncbi:MAG: hypothetical protein JNJ60_19680 [Rhodocyclaceae bacterium]|nr:hypothetical protein [Rhodocyclaceae bacterium]